MPATALLAILALTPDAVVDSIKANSFPLKTVEAGKGLEDMKKLKTVLKDVKIVGMGEPTHGSREVFQMKHRMFEFLVAEMGYTVFALEASMPDCVAMDRYVLTGEGDVNKAVRAQGFWTWATEEVADLIKWMRKYNEDPAHKNKLRVVGVDMQSRLGAGNFLKNQFVKAGLTPDPIWDTAVKYNPRPDLDLDKIEKLVADALPKIKEKLGPEEAELAKRVSLVFRQAYQNEGSGELMRAIQKVSGHLGETVSKAPGLLNKHSDLKGDALLGMQILEKASVSNYQPTEDEQKKMRGWAKALAAYAAEAKEDKEDLARCADVLDYFALAMQGQTGNGTNFRDKCMAQNMEWAIKTYLPGQKAMLWAHNGHVARWKQTSTFQWMGCYLDDIFKSAYYPVGFSFYEGSFQAMDAKMTGLKEWTAPPAAKGTLDELLNQVGPPVYFVPFAKLSKEAQEWMDTPRSTRSIGAVYSEENADKFFYPLPNKKMFDGMIFIRKTTRARPLPR